MSDFFQNVYAWVRKIPEGKVATYGQIAALIGHPRAARMVGWALHQLPPSKLSDIPWHRVINRHGDISTTCLDHTADEQAFLLKKEGITVSEKDNVWHVDLARFQWNAQQ